MSVTVVIASNYQGKVDPFVFEDRRDAHMFAGQLRGKGQVDTVLVYEDIELLDRDGASRLTFGVRGSLGALCTCPMSLRKRGEHSLACPARCLNND